MIGFTLSSVLGESVTFSRVRGTKMVLGTEGCTECRAWVSRLPHQPESTTVGAIRFGWRYGFTRQDTLNICDAAKISYLHWLLTARQERWEAQDGKHKMLLAMLVHLADCDEISQGFNTDDLPVDRNSKQLMKALYCYLQQRNAEINCRFF